MKCSIVIKFGQFILGKYVGFIIVGFVFCIMGIGFIVVIFKFFVQYNIILNDVDVVEINEVFVSMVVYCWDKFGFDWVKMNFCGGVIVFGYLLGVIGVR